MDSHHLATIDPALWRLGPQPSTDKPQHQDDELPRLLAPLSDWYNWEGLNSNAFHRRSPRQHSQSSPPPGPMHSLGSFKPRIARRIAKRVYRTNWRDWERARESWLYPGGGDGRL